MTTSRGNQSPRTGMDRQEPRDHLSAILRNMSSRIIADAICVYTYDYTSKRLTAVDLLVQNNTTIRSEVILSKWIQSQVDTLCIETDPESRVVALDEHDCQQARSAIVWPMDIHGDLLGVVALLSKESDHFSDGDIDSLAIWIRMAQMILENDHLRKQLATAEATTVAARAIAREPSPENIIQILRDHLFGSHVSSCLVTLFGPTPPDNPHGPYEYFEIQASWSRSMGSSVGIGHRFFIADHKEIVDHLNVEPFVALTDMENLKPQLSDFDRAMLASDNIQSVTLLPLRSEERNLGVLIITSDEPYHFSLYELLSYQVIGELVAMSALAAVFEQQADYVQQGRAALLDTMTDSVIMVLPDDAASVLTVNSQFTNIFELEEIEVRGLPLRELLNRIPMPAPIRRDLSREWLAIAADDPSELRGEFTMTTQKGIPSDIQWYSRPVYQNQKVMGRIYILHDVTPERVTERLRTELLSRVSHELRTPVTSIRGFAEFILEAVGEELPPLAKEYTEIILKSAIHLNRRFTDILEVTRANAGELHLHITGADMPDVIREVVARLEPQTSERNQKVVVESGDSLPSALVDVERIDQVISNLLTNAIKYAPPESTIRVSTELIEASPGLPRSSPADTLTPCLLVRIADEGKGLTQEEADKIFMPFYRTDRAHQQQIDGAGLGLAIAQSIVELHRGKIWVEATSRKEPGGKFFLTLPIHDG